ncbi:MAG TPA: hypothetical protein VIF88_12020 [Methylocystis sp.]|jgi:hypothetical protein
MSTLKNQPKVVRCYRINYNGTLGDVAVLRTSDLDIEPHLNEQKVVIVTLAESGRRLFGRAESLGDAGIRITRSNSMVVHLDGSPVDHDAADYDEVVVILQALNGEGNFTVDEATAMGGWLCVNMEETGVVERLDCKLAKEVETTVRIEVAPIKGEEDEEDDADDEDEAA